MSDLQSSLHTLQSDDPILKRAGHNLGVSWLGAEGSPGLPGYHIHLQVTIPQRYHLRAIFPNKNPDEVSPYKNPDEVSP